MADRTWTNSGGDGDLANTANYEDATVPVTGDGLLFSEKSTGPPTLNMDTFTGTKATGTLTFVGNPVDGEIVTIGTTVYRFKTVMAAINDVQRDGASAETSADNLVAAIMVSGTEGVEYFAGTNEHPDVTAVDGAGTTVDVTAKVGGTAGNAITTTTDVTGASWGAATLTGGTDFTLVLLFAGDDSNVDVGQDGNPLILNILTKGVNQGNGGMHLQADTITRVICNSDHNSDGVTETPALRVANTTTLTALVCVKGRIEIADSVTTLTRVLVSFRDDPFSDVNLDVGSSSNAIAEFRQVSGEAVLNRLPTLCSVEDGALTILETAPAATVTRIEVSRFGRVDYRNTQQITSVNVYSGTFDTTGITNKLTILLIAVWPAGTFLKSDDLVTYGGGAIEVDLTGGDV